MKISGDGEESEAAIYLTGVRLGARPDSEAAVEVLTGNDEVRRL